MVEDPESYAVWRRVLPLDTPGVRFHRWRAREVAVVGPMDHSDLPLDSCRREAGRASAVYVFGAPVAPAPSGILYQNCDNREA
jgi:hypothetical protein